MLSGTYLLICSCKFLQIFSVIGLTFRLFIWLRSRVCTPYCSVWNVDAKLTQIFNTYYKYYQNLSLSSRQIYLNYPTSNEELFCVTL